MQTKDGWLRYVARLACLLLALALAAPGPARAESKATPSPAEEPVRIGVVLPMTGSVASYGQMCWMGMLLAQEIEPRVLGRPVKLLLVDDKSDNVEAANATNRLVQKDQVAAILGPATSSRALAAAPIAEAAKVPMVLPTATNPIITQGRKFVFRNCFIDPYQGQVAARYAYEQLGSRRAAIMMDVSQDYAVALAKFFREEFQKLGGKVVAMVKCNTGDQDFSAQLGTLQSFDADLLYLPMYYSEDALVARQAQELGLKLPMLSGDGAQAPELVKIGGPAVEGFTFTAHFHPDAIYTDLGRKFLAKFQEAQANGKIGEGLTSFHALGAESYLLLLDAISRAGKLDGQAIRDALVATKDFGGITGKISLGEDGNAVKAAVLLKVQKGDFVYVTSVEP
ncbi:MAG: ABC transporter substrate-binding protein [Deltaproteobacteria bacterium]|nr:ABC transporter substrate-binding protein [Deltaproteobacteria bacterium]